MRLLVEGEGTYVSALASLSYNRINLVLVNYDPEEKNIEMVPITINNIDNGDYYFKKKDVLGNETKQKITVLNNQLTTNLLMTPNSIWAIELEKINQ